MNANKLRYFLKKIFPGESINSTLDATFMLIYLLRKWHERGKEKNIKKGHTET